MFRLYCLRLYCATPTSRLIKEGLIKIINKEDNKENNIEEELIDLISNNNKN
jgi:hypothetical protein